MSNQRDAIEFAGFPEAETARKSPAKEQVQVGTGNSSVESNARNDAPAQSKDDPRNGMGRPVAILILTGLAFLFFSNMREPPKESVNRVPASQFRAVDQAPAVREDPVMAKEEQRPIPRAGKVLNQAELRWCVFWDARIERLSKLVIDDPIFPAFNRTVDDLNTLCTGAQYYERDLEVVQKELEIRRTEIETSADQVYRQWAQEHLVPVVRTIQEHLTTLGYQPGPIDGLAGPQTRRAIREIESDFGLEQTGDVSLALRDALNKVVARE